MQSRTFIDCVELVGTACPPFSGTKKYVSTGAVDTDHIVDAETEIVDYAGKPSRADLVTAAGDVLFAKMQGTKKTLLISDGLADHIYSTGFCAVRAKKGILTERCLYHLLTSRMFLTQKDKHCSGATQKAITKAGLEKISIKVPDIEQQETVANLLDSIKRVIEYRQRQLLSLDTLIKARFVELFGDIIRNDMGWPQYVFSDIANSRLGKMLDAKQQTGKYRFPYLANFNVQWFRFELENLNEMDFNEADQVEFQLRDGDLLVCEGGEIGRCAVWHNEVHPCYFQKALHRVRCKSEIVLPDYLARWFQYNCEHGGFASIEGAKATIAHLPGAKLKQLKVTVPPLQFQERFVTFVAQVDKSKLIVQEALRKTQLLFDSLMQQYFG